MPPHNDIDRLVIDRDRLTAQLEAQWSQSATVVEDLDLIEEFENGPDRWIVARGAWDESKPCLPDADPGLMLVKAFPRRHLILRRVFDVTVASLVLIAALPIMLLVALAVRLTSRGPVLFRHARVGLGGELFDVMKFRTMAHGTHDELHATPELHAEYVQNNFKLSADSDRITNVGKILRKTSLDELPQLLNVLKGDMSIVGIRPLVPLEVTMRPMSDQLRYCLLRPGITGLWQVSGRSTVTDDERYALDRSYVDRWHPTADLKILLQTPAALLRTHHAA